MEQVQTEASKSGQMQEREPASAGQRQFLRTIPLLGEEGVARLRASHVAVFGLGAWAPLRPRRWRGPVWAH